MSIPSIYELHDVFFNEKNAIQYLRNLEVFYSSRLCPQCNYEMSYLHNKESCHCSKKNCRKQKSGRKGSFFYGLRLQINQVLFISYFWLNKILPTSVKIMSNVAIQTVIDMSNILENWFQLILKALIAKLADPKL